MIWLLQEAQGRSREVHPHPLAHWSQQHTSTGSLVTAITSCTRGNSWLSIRLRVFGDPNGQTQNLFFLCSTAGALDKVYTGPSYFALPWVVHPGWTNCRQQPHSSGFFLDDVSRLISILQVGWLVSQKQKQHEYLM
jgi:hypothetical protein